MKQLIHNDWWEVLKPQFESSYYSQLHDFLKEEYTHRTIYPEMHHIFEAFEWTPFSEVKVVILGKIRTMVPTRHTGVVFRYYQEWRFHHLCKISIRSCKVTWVLSR